MGYSGMDPYEGRKKRQRSKKSVKKAKRGNQGNRGTVRKNTSKGRKGMMKY